MLLIKKQSILEINETVKIKASRGYPNFKCKAANNILLPKEAGLEPTKLVLKTKILPLNYSFKKN